VLSLVRSIENTFASINQIPSEILSLIPDCLDERDTGLVALTHVCRGWREIFTSRSSLWAFLDCINPHKTLTYIERSGSFPLDIHLERLDDQSYCDDAFLLLAPHVGRLGSLTVCGTADIMPDLIRQFSHPTPLLKELRIDLAFDRDDPPAFPATLFSGDLSSLSRLSLSGLATDLPWRNLVNLTTLQLSNVFGTAEPSLITRLLDFFESAPFLSNIEIRSISNLPNLHPRRVVPIPHLKELILSSPYVYSTLVNHLAIPTGASLVLTFPFGGESSPILDCLPKDFRRLDNLSHITAINLFLDQRANYVRFSGPSGQLYLYSTWLDLVGPSWNVAQCRILQSLEKFNLSNTRRLTVTKCTFSPLETLDGSPIFKTLLLLNDLRTLTLIKCENLPVIHALNPDENGSGAVACPNLEELVLYIKKLDWFYISELKEMALARAGRCAKLPSITIVSLGEMLPREEVFILREYFPCVEYKVDIESPRWDAIPDDKSAHFEVVLVL